MDRSVRAIDWQRNFTRVDARVGAKDLSLTSPLTGQVEGARTLGAGATMRLTERLEATAFRQQVVSGAALPEYPTRTAAGLNWAGLMRLPTKGPPSVIAPRALHAADATCVKSPASIAAVGTNVMLSAGVWVARLP